MVINGCHTDNGNFDTSDFMEKQLKNNKKIRFSGYGFSHKNGAAVLTIKMVVNMARKMLIHAVLRCPKDILSTDFGQ